jgi:hypothetical protein
MNICVEVDRDLPQHVTDLFVERGYDAVTIVMQSSRGVLNGELWHRVPCLQDYDPTTSPFLLLGEREVYN